MMIRIRVVAANLLKFRVTSLDEDENEACSEDEQESDSKDEIKWTRDGNVEKSSTNWTL